jgi:hypothetical protein
MIDISNGKPDKKYTQEEKKKVLEKRQKFVFHKRSKGLLRHNKFSEFRVNDFDLKKQKYVFEIRETVFNLSSYYR